MMDAKRGFVPEDERNFSPESLKILRTASRHVCWLLNEGYGLKQAVTFVGNHFLLSERQRLAVQRSVADDRQLELRKKRRIPAGGLSGKTVWVDGFNEIIVLEVMLCGSPLFEGMDGAIRDLAALRGTYRLIPETDEAVRLMLTQLKKEGVRDAVVLLDRPVSNSGRLKGRVADTAEELGVKTDVRVLRGVDRELYGKDAVISSDSVILDHCAGWFNLTGMCLEAEGRTALRVWAET